MSLTDQTGETGFVISQKSTNRLLFTRSSSLPGPDRSTYTFDNVLNPLDIEAAFAVLQLDRGELACQDGDEEVAGAAGRFKDAPGIPYQLAHAVDDRRWREDLTEGGYFIVGWRDDSGR